MDINFYKRRIEGWLTDSGSENAESAARSKIDVVMENGLLWLFCNLTPVYNRAGAKSSDCIHCSGRDGYVELVLAERTTFDSCCLYSFPILPEKFANKQKIDGRDANASHVKTLRLHNYQGANRRDGAPNKDL